MKFKIYLLSLLFSTAIFAQKQIETKIDVTKNKIGAQFNLTLKTNVDSMAVVVFPKGKLFGKMEVIRSYVIDTVKKGGRYELIKKYGLAQFDSGKFYIPSLKVVVGNKTFPTDSILVEVLNVPVDTLKQKMYDIKPIVAATTSKSWVWKLLLILSLLAVIGIGIYKLIQFRQRKKIEAEVFKTPIQKATNLLQILEKKELWQKGEIKNYYSELTDIARNYIEEAIEIPAMESTTSELIHGLKIASLKKKMTLSVETIANLEKVLKQADLVKFAKSIPLDFEIAEDRKKIESAIVTLDQSIPIVQETEDEMLLNELQRQEQLKMQLYKKRKSRIITTIAILVCCVTGLLVFFTITKGFDFVKDNIIGHPTKELLEGEWVRSTYTDAEMTILTPKVLKRLDFSKMIPAEAQANIQTMSAFGYGSIIDPFYLMLTSVTFKQAVDTDTSKALEGVVASWKAIGCKNILLEKQEYQSKDGASGLKAFGTYEILDPTKKENLKMYFEIYLFKEKGGLQQLLFTHQQGDRYAIAIEQKIINSFEFKKENTNE